MNKIFLSVVFLSAFTGSLLADSQEVKSQDLIADDAKILAFVSHKEATAYFLKAREELKTLHASYIGELGEVLNSFPLDLKTQQYGIFTQGDFAGEYGFLGDIVFRHLEEYMGAFLSLGILEISEEIDEKEKAEIQDLQVKLFKNWVGVKQGAPVNREVEKELIDFSQRSSLPFFSQVIAPTLLAYEGGPSGLATEIEVYTRNEEKSNDEDDDDFDLESIMKQPRLKKIGWLFAFFQEEGLDFNMFSNQELSFKAFSQIPSYMEKSLNVEAEMAIDEWEGKYFPWEEESDPIHAVFEKYFSLGAISDLFFKITE
jgi:hypothetical protein